MKEFDRKMAAKLALFTGPALILLCVFAHIGYVKSTIPSAILSFGILVGVVVVVLAALELSRK